MLQYIDLKDKHFFKKIFISLLFLIFLSGCSSKYILSYENNIYSESLKIYQDVENEINNNELLIDTFNYYYNNVLLPIDYFEDSDNYLSDNNYEKILNNNSLKLNYNFLDSASYSNSKIINTLFSDVIITDEAIIATNTKNIYDIYPILNNLFIEFKTDKMIFETNADEIKNNQYYWYINHDNYKSKKIIIKFNKEEKKDNKEYIKEGYLTDNFINLIIIILISIVFIISIIICSKVKNSNKKW